MNDTDDTADDTAESNDWRTALATYSHDGYPWPPEERDDT